MKLSINRAAFASLALLAACGNGPITGAEAESASAQAVTAPATTANASTTGCAHVASTSATRMLSAYVQSGKDLGWAINCAQSDMISQNIVAGTVDATDLTGAWDVTSPVQLGSNWDNSFTLLLGRVHLSMSATITIGRNSAIKGVPTGSNPWGTNSVNPRATVLQAAANSNMGHILLVGGTSTGDGTSAVIQDLIIDGNYPNHGQAQWSNCIFIDRAGAVEVTRVSVVQCGGHGVSISSSTTGENGSGNAVLTKVFAASNTVGAGLAITNSADTMVSDSQFENSNYGAYLNNALGIRINHSDFGGNAIAGLRADQGSNSLILTGNQFGNNTGTDLELLNGWGGNVVNGNQFVGEKRGSQYNIFVSGTTNTAITGNFVNRAGMANTAQCNTAGIYLAGGSHSLSGNVITGQGICDTNSNIVTGSGATYVGQNLSN